MLHMLKQGLHIIKMCQPCIRSLNQLCLATVCIAGNIMRNPNMCSGESVYYVFGLLFFKMTS